MRIYVLNGKPAHSNVYHLDKRNNKRISELWTAQGLNELSDRFYPCWRPIGNHKADRIRQRLSDIQYLLGAGKVPRTAGTAHTCRTAQQTIIPRLPIKSFSLALTFVHT